MKKKSCWFDDQFKDPEFLKAFLDERQNIFREEIRIKVADTKRAERSRAYRIVSKHLSDVGRPWVQLLLKEILGQAKGAKR